MRRGKRWQALVGNALFAGRYPVLPAPWAPGAPVFRADWATAGAAQATDRPGVEALLGLLRPLRWPARALAMVLFVAVPAALLWYPHPVLMLGLLCVAYLLAAGSMAYVARRRIALGLSRKDVVAIGIDAIACPPFAINLARRISLRHGLDASADAFAQVVLDAPAQAHLQATMQARRAWQTEGAESAGRDGAIPRDDAEDVP